MISILPSPLEPCSVEQNHDRDHPEAQEHKPAQEDGKTDDDHSSHQLKCKHQSTVIKLYGKRKGERVDCVKALSYSTCARTLSVDSTMNLE